MYIVVINLLFTWICIIHPQDDDYVWSFEDCSCSMLCLAAAGWIPGNAKDAVAAKLNTFPLSSNYSLLDHSMCKMPVDRKKLQISSFSAMCEIQLGSMYSITSLTTNLGRSLQTNHRWYPLALAALLPLSIQEGFSCFCNQFVLPVAHCFASTQERIRFPQEMLHNQNSTQFNQTVAWVGHDSDSVSVYLEPAQVLVANFGVSSCWPRSHH